MNILLTNQYAGNKGDRAVLYALCNLILDINPNANITVSTSNPNLWDGYKFYHEHNIRFIPYAWDYSNLNGIYWKALNRLKKYTFTILRESYIHGLNVSQLLSNPEFHKSAKQSDIIISVGGHHFTTILSTDLVSSINFDTAAALSQNKKIFCFSQSFGPFQFRNSRNHIFTKKILKNCKLLFPREISSVRELKNMEVPEDQILSTYESVISLNKLFKTYTPVNQRKKRIGIAIYATQRRTPKAYEEYVLSMARFCDYVTSKGYDVVFFPMELKGSAPDDRPLIYSIISKIENKTHIEVIESDLETRDHLIEVANCQLFVGHKTHSTIFALTTGTPLIGIAYHPKTIEFMKQFKVGEYGISDNELTVDKLISLFEKIEPSLDRVGRDCFTKAKQISQVIESDFKNILTK